MRSGECKRAGDVYERTRLGVDVTDNEFDLLIVKVEREPHHVLWDWDQ